MRLNLFLPPGRKADRGLLRRGLAGIGPTWSSSPLRRIVQSACLLAFFLLFFYVCWPYTARPARSFGGWLPAEVDSKTGRATVVNEGTPADMPSGNGPIHVVDRDAGYLGAFRISDFGQNELSLEPVEVLAPERLDALLASFGPWSLGEVEPGSWPAHYADDLQSKESPAGAEIFLALDPLVSISTALAARCWVWSLWAAGTILLVCLVVPRGFCGYVCPLGTLIDLFDWSLGRRVRWVRVSDRGWWVRVKYYLLLAVVTAALAGILFSGFVAAIPLLTRAAAFLLTPLQTAAERGWHQVPAPGAGQLFSIVLFAAVLGLGLFRPRFWCKYVCPSGALFSTANLLRLTERKVDQSCIGCKACVEICPFDAIKADFSTRTADCTFCQTCGGVCPVGAIQFVSRFKKVEPPAADDSPGDDSAGEDPPPADKPIPRRGFLAAGIAATAATAGGIGAAAATGFGGARLDDPLRPRLVRPPGSVPEEQFLQLCIRCGECFQACPNDVLQPLGFQQGLEGLWTPQVVADWSGCEPSCNNCGQVCPTGAIRALPLEEKRVARMGLAVVDRQTCLPYAGREACQLCVDECATAGYRAIEFLRVGTEVDDAGNPIEDTGLLAPVVLPEACVGCGLCQTRCLAINARQKGLLKETAIRIEAGPGNEDRMMSGSYVGLREEERRKQQEELQQPSQQPGGYLPDFLDQGE